MDSKVDQTLVCRVGALVPLSFSTYPLPESSFFTWSRPSIFKEDWWLHIEESNLAITRAGARARMRACMHLKLPDPFVSRGAFVSRFVDISDDPRRDVPSIIYNHLCRSI